jgi:hypothetical protein
MLIPIVSGRETKRFFGGELERVLQHRGWGVLETLIMGGSVLTGGYTLRSRWFEAPHSLLCTSRVALHWGEFGGYPTS